MAGVDDPGYPLYVDLATVAGDAVAALEALERLELPRARLAAGLPRGEAWAQAHRGWDGRLLLHHACLAEPDAPRWNLAAGDDPLRLRAVGEAAETMRVAAGLGAPFYSLEAGWALALTHDGDDRPVGVTTTPRRAEDQLCRSLDRLAGLADDLGLRLLVEPAPLVPAERPAFAEPERMRAVLERLGAPPLALQVDLPALVATARRIGEDPEAILDFLKPWLAALVLHRGRHQALREADVELAAATHAGGLASPVTLSTRGLSGPVLLDQVAMATELLRPTQAERLSSP